MGRLRGFCLLLLAALPTWGAISVDATTSADSSAAGVTITTPAFNTTQGNELLLAFIATDYNTGSNTTVQSVSGAGLTWVLVVRTNAQSGTSEIWRAFSPSSLSNVTVTANLSQAAVSSLTVMSFAGVDTTGTSGSGAIGAIGSSNGSSGAPTASLVTTRNNSWVIGTGNDYDNAIARTLGSGQTLVHQYLASIGDTYWVQMQSSPTPLSGTSVTINDTAPTTDRYNLSICEILPAQTAAPAASPTWSISGTISPATAGSGAIVTLSGAASSSTTADSSGNYTLSGLANGTYTVAASKTGIAFTPTSQSVTINSASVTGINFTQSSTTSSLIFDEEFNGTALDTTAWVAMNRPGDSSNSELECYKPANAAVSGGSLVLTAKVDSSCSGYNYTSSMVQWKTFNFTYGTVEFRAKMAGGKGTWPAVWMLGSNCQQSNISSADNTGTCNWPNPGSDEIDITEIKDGALSTVWQNVISGSSGFQTCTPTTSDTSQNWHVYSLVWAPGSLIWKIDGVTTCTFTRSIPSTPMFLMVNIAMGGAGGTIVNSTLPQTLSVDYIRVYSSGSTLSPCDLNADGFVNTTDYQLAINQALGSVACGTGDLNRDGVCTVIDVQRVANAVQGQSCRVGP